MSSIAEDIATKNRLDRKTEIAKVIAARTEKSDEQAQEIAEEILALSERFNRKPKATKTKTKTK